MGVNKVVFGAVSIMDISDSTVTKDTLVEGSTAYGADGEKLIGANPYKKVETDQEVNTQATLISEIKTALEGKAGGGTAPVIKTLEVTENGTYTAPTGVDGYSPVVVDIPTSAGMVVKSGTTTSRTINTGLSDVEQFFMYKETQTGTGLIRLHYTKDATSRMYASAWSTQNYGTKTITNGTGGVSVSGGTVTISATQATQGALTSGVTYKWIAIGKE